MKKYDLTFPQRNIWMVENFYDSQLINIISGSFVIKRDFDTKKAEQMVNKFVELNEGMRLRIEVDNNIPKQYVVPFMPFEADKKDISRMTEEEIEIFKDEYIAKEIDILGGPLFSYLLLDRGNGLGEVFVKIHHIIGDAWTISKMGTAFSEIYEKILNGEEYIETFPSYIDFIEAEQEYLKSEKYEKDNEFWKEYLKNSETPVGLKDSGVINDTKAKRHTIVLDEKYQLMLDEYCKQNRVSPYTVFLSALAIYTERVTEKTDFILGTPVLNRSNFKEKNMSGMFISTMPVRFKINENETFLDFVKRTGTESLTLFRHQKYPYLKISEIYKNIAGTNDNMYKLILSYQNARASVAVQDKYELRWRFSGHIQDELEIHVSDLNDTGRLEVHFDYLTNLFEDVEIEYLTKRILAIIEDGITNNSKIETIKIMSDEERYKILNDFNNTARPYPKDKTIIELFEEQVKLHPNKVALVFENSEMTYSELNSKANKLAWYLKDKGVKEHDFIAITIDKSFELMIAILAVLKTGACYVPIDVDYSIDRKEYIIKDANCKYNLTVTDNENYSEYINIKTLDLSKYSYENLERSKEYTWDSLVYVMYTSGTTGKPKGAMITNRNIVRLVKNTNYITFEPNDRIIQTGATVFDASTFEYWGALLNGLSLCLIKKLELLDPFALEEFIDKNKITIMWLTAPLYTQMVETNIKLFKNIRVILAGGDVLSLKHVNLLKHKYNDIIVVNGYGPTENTTFSNCHIVNEEYQQRIPIGRPIANSICYVVDSKMRLLPIGVQGELIVGGDGVCKGYLNNPELTNQKFVENRITNNGIIYKTGDIVCWREDGSVDFFGRRDNQVKIRGFRVELDEIRNCIQRYNKIKECVIVVKLNDVNQKDLYAYFVSSEKEELSKLKEFLSNNLAKYMMPKAILQVDKIPLNTNGKVDVSKLPDIEIKSNGTMKEDRSQLEKDIIKIVYEKFQVQLDSVTDNLFEFGLDSLSIIKLTTDINNEFNVDLKFADVISNPTVKGIEKLVSSNNTKITKNSYKDKIELNLAQKGIFTNYMNNTESLRYNIPFELVIYKPIEIEKLRNSIETVVNHCHKLFMNIVVDNGEIYGKINYMPLSLNQSVCTEEEYMVLKNNFVKPMDLLNDRLFKIEIYNLSNRICVLFDINHIVFDGYSMNLLLGDIFRLYNGEKTLIQNTSDNTIINTEEYNKSKEFMMDKFKDFSHETILSSENEESEKGEIKLIQIDENTNSILKQLCKENKVTMNSIFNTAFVLALADVVNDNDIVIGMSTLGRKSMTEYSSVGMFVKTIPIRYIISNDMLKEIILNFQNNIYEFMKNDSYPYFDMIKDLKIARHHGRNPLFNIVYSYQGKEELLKELNGSKVSINQIQTNTSKFELSCQVVDDGNSPYVIFEYNPDLVDSLKLEELVNKFRLVINCICNNIHIKVNEILSIKQHARRTSEVISVAWEQDDLPLTENEEIVLSIYNKVLESNIKMDDNFFEVGGDSLLAIKLLSEFIANNMTVTYADIFEYNTPRKLFRKIFGSVSHERIDSGIEDYDYSFINALLDKQSPSVLESNNIGNVLLTGATGFLGAHILDEYLTNQIGNIYCLVRKVGNISSENRLKERLQFFFGNKYDNEFGKRIKVIEGDIIYKDLLEDGKLSKEIINDIDIVINSAAHVKHYGNKELFYKINVEGVDNLIEFCKINNIKLVQVSTLSVSGNLIESGQLEQNIKSGTHFDENNLYIGQNLDNIYVYTKFLAERRILEEIIYNKLDAKIVRMGNLTGRTTDGKFQPNVEDNAFANRIKSILEIENIPENIRNLYLEFTPIDKAANCIINICKNTSSQIVYHIFNHKHLPMEKAYEYFKDIGYSLEWISKEDMHNLIKTMLKDSNNKDKLSGIVQDLNNNADLEYTSNTIIDSKISRDILKKHGFEWENVSKEYFYSYIQYLREINFLKGGKNGD